MVVRNLKKYEKKDDQVGSTKPKAKKEKKMKKDTRDDDDEKKKPKKRPVDGTGSQPSKPGKKSKK